MPLVAFVLSAVGQRCLAYLSHSNNSRKAHLPEGLGEHEIRGDPRMDVSVAKSAISLIFLFGSRICTPNRPIQNEKANETRWNFRAEVDLDTSPTNPMMFFV